MTIRPERPEDVAAIRELTHAAFGRELEALIPERVRATDRFVPELSLVAEEDGEVVGHVLLSEFDLGATRVLQLGPLSVAPERQRRGIGSALVHEALARADARGEPLVLLEGDPAYYGRFGFRPAAELGIEAPEGVPARYFQAVPLQSYDPSLRGRVAYPDAFRG